MVNVSFSIKRFASISFPTPNPEKTARAQVPGTAQPKNVEDFMIKGQQQQRLKGNSCVHA